ncbi:MAG: hypothetical protein P8Z68_03320 [Kineosporiaceae bacterium]
MDDAVPGNVTAPVEGEGPMVTEVLFTLSRSASPPYTRAMSSSASTTTDCIAS